MSATDALLAIAQIAATFAGFTAIMALINPNEGRDHKAIAGFRVKMVLSQALLTLFLCLIPILILPMEILDFTAWQLANGIFIIAGIGRTTSAARSIRRASQSEGVKVNRFSATVNFTASTSAIILSSLALCFPTLARLTSAYLFGCAAMLLISAMAFFFLVHQLSPDTNEE